MTRRQIYYFLTTAKCMNFSEAANQLHITQPALSQHIRNIERELNMQLFVRDKHKVYLTPAATVLLKELPQYNLLYEEIIEHAQKANEGKSGHLRLGLLDNLVLDDEIIDKCFQFQQEHPAISFLPVSGTFGELRRMLDEKEVDLIFTIEHDIKDDYSIISKRIAVDRGVFLLSKRHPLANEETLSWEQLKGNTFIDIRSEDSAKINQMVMDSFRARGFSPRMLFADNVRECSLWVEFGLGVGIASHKTVSRFNPNLVAIPAPEIAEQQFVFAWKKDNTNPALSLFVNQFDTYYDK